MLPPTRSGITQASNHAQTVGADDAPVLLSKSAFASHQHPSEAAVNPMLGGVRTLRE